MEKPRVKTLLTWLSPYLSICSVCQHPCSVSNTRLLSVTVESLILSKSDKGEEGDHILCDLKRALFIVFQN